MNANDQPRQTKSLTLKGFKIDLFIIICLIVGLIIGFIIGVIVTQNYYYDVLEGANVQRLCELIL